MSNSNAEKEWLRRFNEHRPTEEQQPVPQEPPKQAACKPAKKGNGFADIAGMQALKQFITDSFINVLNHRECANRYGIQPPSMLFYGPSGCGKSFFAEKMAEEVHIHYMKIVPDDLAYTWIHGTQQKIGEIFREAAKNAPTLLFFDEFDAMVPQRSGDEANEHLNGEVNEFLCMLNNATERGIYVMAATNHPERIDKALLRTGRIDELIYIDIPDLEARESLFSLCLSKLPVETDINYQRLANLTDGYTCSDISYIVKSAARKMFNATIRSETERLCPITQALLEEIISTKQSSVNRKDLRAYERIRNEFSPKDKGCKPVTIGYR
ncbi:MAG: ATP-binding protein [bacterium]|nr:ATP-binding protein [bacterium]